MPVSYSVLQRFDPSCGDKWKNFIAWSRLTQFREVISMDRQLCPTVFRDLTDEDWHHYVPIDFYTLFNDLDYVLNKVVGDDRVNVLALMQNPTEEEFRSFIDPRFVFRGFDLVELATGISALVNCGGVFVKAFSHTDLSECGLLTDYAQAFNVQKLLRAEYPNEPHAECDLWAIWQMKMRPEFAGDQP